MKSSPHIALINLIIIISLSMFIIVSPSEGAGKTSFGLTGGFGMPLGWWGERWDPLQSGELNLKYEFAPGSGLLLLVGLNKAYYKSMSDEDIAAESRFSDVKSEFQPYRTIVYASQSGSFKQIPFGFGFYHERMAAMVRIYGSVAMVVYNWKIVRDQRFKTEVETPIGSIEPQADDWVDSQDGADLGLQVAVGGMYKVFESIYLDVSAAFHWVNINQKNGAFAYYGYPARTPPGDPESKLVSNAKASVNFIQLRIGVRVGN